MIRAISSYTVHPNTPETDKMPVVEHEVTLSDGQAVRIMAPAPDNAIDIINRLSDEELSKLKRVKPKWIN